MAHPARAALPALLALASCATDTQVRNRTALNQLQLGMSKDDVQKQLGPAETSESVLVEGKELLVWWYTTAYFTKDPVVFEDGKVTGWGPSAKSKLPAKK
jgi:hypothetical protein